MDNERKKFTHLAEQSSNIRKTQAEANFTNKINFYENLAEKILPCIRKMIFHESLGTGFLFAPGWLVSNSHVVHNVKDLELGCWGAEKISVNEAAYFRPKDLGGYPDLMVANIHDDTSSSIPLKFTEGEAHEEQLYFYIDKYDSESPIKFLNKHSSEGYLQIYSQEDGNIPLAGISGSPIIAARVLIGKIDEAPNWEFRLDGVLFAYQEESILLHSVPLQHDLMQIRDIMILEMHKKRVDAIISLGNSSHSLWQESTDLADNITAEQRFYAVGEGAHYINLPIDLVPLNGKKGVIPLDDSLYLRKDFWKKNKGILSHLEAVEDFDPKVLKEELGLLLSQLNENHSIALLSQSTSGLYSTKRLRIDRDGIGLDKHGSRFSIQDNFKAKNGHALKDSCNEPFSGVFASVRVYSQSNHVDSKVLKMLLLKSLDKLNSLKYRVDNLNGNVLEDFNKYYVANVLPSDLKRKPINLYAVRDLAHDIHLNKDYYQYDFLDKYEFSDDVLAKAGIAFVSIIIKYNKDKINILEYLATNGFKFEKCSNDWGDEICAKISSNFQTNPDLTQILGIISRSITPTHNP